MSPPAADVDAFEALGNPGWNWAGFEKYSKKVERLANKHLIPTSEIHFNIRSFHVSAKEQTDIYPYTYDLKFWGTSEPIQVIIPSHYYTVDALVNQTLVNRGLKILMAVM